MKIRERKYSQRKGYREGTERARSPRETFGEVSPLMPKLGITRLANVTGLDRIGLPVYVSIRPNSRGLATSQGKGEDKDSAKVSALMESIESWHGERIDHALRYESYLELRRQATVVDVTEVSRRAGSILRFETPLLWIEGWDLMRQEPIWVPFEAVSTNYVSSGTEPAVFLQSSNGLASGNHLLEAINHGICEVIERDAVTLDSFTSPTKRKLRQLDLDSVDSPMCRRVIARLAAVDLFVAAWDITSDVGIPAFTCTILETLDRPRWRAMPAFSGHGCHLSPAIALMRALTEAVQSRLTIISGSRDDMFPRDYANARHEDDHRRMLEEYSTPAPTLPFASVGPEISDNFETDMETLLGALRRVGIERVVVVDLSKPDLGVPVVKVVIPGLEGYLTPSTLAGKRARALAASQQP